MTPLEADGWAYIAGIILALLALLVALVDTLRRREGEPWKFTGKLVTVTMHVVGSLASRRRIPRHPREVVERGVQRLG
jgi:hypothetical protein